MSRFIRCVLCLCFVYVITTATPALAKTVSDDSASPAFMTSGGFCPDGVIPKVRWRFGEQVEGLSAWGSFCRDEAHTGRIESAEFLAPATLSLSLSGYPGTPGLRLSLQLAESGEEIELRPKSTPGAQWQWNNFGVPRDWVGKPVRMSAEAHASGLDGWLGFTAPLLPYSSIAVGAIPTDQPQGGFCPNGVYGHPQWPAGGPPAGVVAWGSFCQSGNDGTGWTASKPVIASSFLSVYLAGYPGSPNIRLAVESLQTGRQLPLQMESAPGNSWRLFHFPLPSRWEGQPVRLLVEDHAARPDGWVGFTEPGSMPGLKSEALFAGRILGLASLLFVVLMLPPAATVVIAFLRGVRDPLDLITAGLLAMGLIGYAALWIYFFSRVAGIAYSYIVLLSSCAVLVFAWRSARNRIRLRALRRMVEPVVLVGLASVFVLSLGFVYGRPASVQDYAAHRFGPRFLWIDNFLPKLFADGIYQGHVPRPLASDWLSSDRPPLQTGMVLWVYPCTRGTRELLYQTAATILQLTFLAGLWAYLEAAKVSRKAMALALATTFVSGFVILNSFYTWPKLLPVAFLFVVPAYLFTDRFSSVRADWRAGASVGAAAGFAMLCHGGSAFALLGIGLTLLILRRLPTLRLLLPAALVAGFLYFPWMLYQKYYDPPGDRLLKMHLAGVQNSHPEAQLSDLLISNYRRLHGEEILDYKLRNFFWLCEDLLAFWRHAATMVQTSFTGNQTQRAAAVAFLRDSMFLHWFSSIDILGLAPLVLLLCPILWGGPFTGVSTSLPALVVYCNYAGSLVPGDVWTWDHHGPRRVLFHRGRRFRGRDVGVLGAESKTGGHRRDVPHSLQCRPLCLADATAAGGLRDLHRTTQSGTQLRLFHCRRGFCSYAMADSLRLPLAADKGSRK